MIISKYLIFLVPCIYTLNYSSAEFINCDIHNNLPVDENEEIRIDEGILTVKYDRNELGVYKYKNTTCVNILLYDVGVTFNGSLFKNSSSFEFNISSPIHTNIEGIAVLTENSTLINCDLKLLTNLNYTGDLLTILQDKLFYLANPCLETTLCNQLGTINQDDYLRAEIEPHDFGDNSVLYNQLGEKFPNIDLPSSNNPATLQTTLNIFTDFMLSGVISRVSGRQLGKVDLPDLREVIPAGPLLPNGYFNLINGTFGDLTNIFRTENVHVSNDGLRFTISTEFQIPKARIRYNNYVLHYLLFNDKGIITIDVDSITLGLEIEINYNQSVCKTWVNYVRTRIGDIHFDLTGHGILDDIINIPVRVAIKKFTKNIVTYIKLKLKEVISAPINSFDCERYRP